MVHSKMNLIIPLIFVFILLLIILLTVLVILHPAVTLIYLMHHIIYLPLLPLSYSPASPSAVRASFMISVKPKISLFI
jgi:hypothetical protein